MIELPHPIRFSSTIQPTKLPENCDNMHDDEHVYVVGQGKYNDNKEADGLVRHGMIKIKSCDSLTFDDKAFSDSREICSIQITNQTLGPGDSGMANFFSNFECL